MIRDGVVTSPRFCLDHFSFLLYHGDPMCARHHRTIVLALQAIFAKHGTVESVRFRSIAFAKEDEEGKKMPRKAAFVKESFDDRRKVWVTLESLESVAEQVHGPQVAVLCRHAMHMSSLPR